MGDTVLRENLEQLISDIQFAIDFTEQNLKEELERFKRYVRDIDIDSLIHATYDVENLSDLIHEISHDGHYLKHLYHWIRSERKILEDTDND